MKFYNCEHCNKKLDIDDGTECAVCFAEKHANKPAKVEPTHEQIIEWLNDPKVANFFEAVQKEVAFQKASWSELDAKKPASVWFWLVARLASKALDASGEKRRHHIVTAASVLYLWLDSEK